MKFSDLFRVDWYSVIAEGKLGLILKLMAIVVLWDFPRMALIWVLTEVRLVLGKIGLKLLLTGRSLMLFASVVIPRWQQRIADARWKDNQPY
jgi:hypothetical protein